MGGQRQDLRREESLNFNRVNEGFAPTFRPSDGVPQRRLHQPGNTGGSLTPPEWVPMPVGSWDRPAHEIRFVAARLAGAAAGGLGGATAGRYTG